MNQDQVHCGPDDACPSTSKSLLDLPLECLTIILEHVEDMQLEKIIAGVWSSINKDIKACRLVCQRFHYIASRMLIRDLRVDMSEERLDRLQKTAQHPLFSKGVRAIEVVLHSYTSDFIDFKAFVAHQVWRLADTVEGAREMLEHPEDYEDADEDEEDDSLYSVEVRRAYVQRMEEALEDWTRIANEDTQQVRQPWTQDEHNHILQLLKTHARYLQLLRRQTDLLESGEFLRILSTALPLVTTIRFVGTDNRMCEDFSEWDCMGSDTWDRLHEGMLEPLEYRTQWARYLTSDLSRLVPRTPLAFFEAGAALEHMKFDMRTFDFPLDLVPSADLRRKFASTLPRLKSFRLNVANWSNYSGGEQILADACLPWLEAPNIEKVEIGVGTWNDPEDTGILDVSRLLEKPQFRKLSSISLTGNLSLHLSALELFVDKFGEDWSINPLLSMAGLTLQSGTWAEAIDILRGPVLRQVNLQEPHGAECDTMTKRQYRHFFARKSPLSSSKIERYLDSYLDEVRQYLDGDPIELKKNPLYFGAF